MSLLRGRAVTQISDGGDDDDFSTIDGTAVSSKMSRKIHPAYAVAFGSESIGKTIKTSKVKHHWTFVFPRDAVDQGVNLPLDARTTVVEVVHSTMSGRIEIFVNHELSFGNMMRSESFWKLAKKHTLSPILFDAQLRMKGHDVRVTIKNASPTEFKVWLRWLVISVHWCVRD